MFLRSRLAMRGLCMLAMVLGVGISAQVAGAQKTAKSHVSGSISFLNGDCGGTDYVQNFTDLVNAFNASHPGARVNVNLIPCDQVETKLALLMASGTPPDTFFMPGDALRYLKDGKVIPLEKYINADPVLGSKTKSRYYANKMVMLDNKHIWAAQSGALCSMQLFYNRDLFDKAHVAYPTDKWTWADFLKAAKKLTIRSGGQTTQWGADTGYLYGWDGGWQTMAASNGAKIMKRNFNVPHVYLNDPAVIKTWQFIEDLVFKYKVVPNPATEQALSQNGVSAFQTGKIAMVPDGCWELGAYRSSIKHLGMTLLPRGTTGKRVDPIWFAQAEMISSASKNKALAWEFLRWQADDATANKIQARAGLNCGAPIVKKYDHLYDSAWKGVPGGQACVTSLKGSRYFTLFSPNWAKITDQVINPNWDKFKHGEISAKSLAKVLDSQVNTALQSGS